MSTALILIIIITTIEIYLFIEIGSRLGAFMTIFLIFFTALLGIWYARYEGLNTLKSGISQIIKNELPLYELLSGAALAIGAILLITSFKFLILNKKCKIDNKAINVNEAKLIQADGTWIYIILTLSPCK